MTTDTESADPLDNPDCLDWSKARPAIEDPRRRALLLRGPPRLWLPIALVRELARTIECARWQGIEMTAEVADWATAVMSEVRRIQAEDDAADAHTADIAEALSRIAWEGDAFARFVAARQRHGDPYVYTLEGSRVRVSLP